MSNILADILAYKQGEVERSRRLVSIDELRAQPLYLAPPRDFVCAITQRRSQRPNLIAEIKKASPSAGVIAADFDPVAIARNYLAGGAAALSILTDQHFFQGDLSYLQLVRAAVPLPVLRKDFIIDAYQVHQSRAAGADAILLIAEALSPSRISELAGLARSLALGVLVEIHSADSLATTIAALGTRDEGIILGINNRNLATQTIDIATTEQLAPRVPREWPFVSESGIRTRADVQRMLAAGAGALLIGETLMRSGDPVSTIQTLFKSEN